MNRLHPVYSQDPRTAWNQWRRVQVQWSAEHDRRGWPNTEQDPELWSWNPNIPSQCYDLRCGATTKSHGTPCKRRDINAGGRCKLHGGHSTGPTSAAGKARSAMNGHCRKRKADPM